MLGATFSAQMRWPEQHQDTTAGARGALFRNSHFLNGSHSGGRLAGALAGRSGCFGGDCGGNEHIKVRKILGQPEVAQLSGGLGARC